jgi:hypothetical protein
MNSEERKKFIEKCQQANNLAEQAIEKMYGAMPYPHMHPAYKKIFEKALEKIINEP